MAADLGGSQISALLESVPGIVNVLRSPVADAIVSMIRAGAGVRPFSYQDAEELVQYAVRRGLIGATEGDDVLDDVKGARRGGGGGGRGRSRSVKTAKHPAAKKTTTKKAAKPKHAARKATAKAVRPARKSSAPAKKKAVKKTKKAPTRKAAKKPQRGGKRR